MTMKQSRLCVFAFLSLMYAQVSHAGIVLNPQRIVVMGDENTASLELLNTSDQAERYQIYFENKKMLEDGSIVEIPEGEGAGPYAGDMIRYSPRRVDIDAKGSQTIRLAIRRPNDLPDGEYLSHLALKQIPMNRESEESAKDSNPKDEKTLSFKVQPILKLAIPVIVRQGPLQATAALSDIAIEPAKEGAPTLHFKLHREGNRSLYGDVEIFQLEAGVIGSRIGFAKGLGLYTSSRSRLVRVPLEQKAFAAGQQLLVRFNENGKYGGDNLVEQIFTLSN